MKPLKLKKKGGKKKSKKDGKTTQEEEEKKGANHPVLSGEPLECGQVPPMRKRSPGAICRKIGFHIWGFVDGKCQDFMRGVCGAKIPGFASKDECQRACGPKKASDGGQDYDSWPGPLDPKLEASKAASKFNTKLSTCVTVQLPPVAEHVSDEPLKCGQRPSDPILKPEENCTG